MVRALRTIGIVGCAFIVGGTLPRIVARSEAMQKAAIEEAPARMPPIAANAELASSGGPTTLLRSRRNAEPVEITVPRTVVPGDIEHAIVERARLEVLRGVRYDATYRALLSYPRGDVPEELGACT